MLDPRPFLGKAGLFLLAGLLTALAPVHAQTLTTPQPAAAAAAPLTLAEAIALALAKNTGIAIARREFDATGGAALQAGLRPNPELSLQQEDFRRGRQTSTLQITQTLELGGKRAARTAVAERVREQAATDIELARADVRAQAVLAFHEALVAQERLRLAIVEFTTLECVSWFNHHRLLEPIGYIPPEEAEANYYRQLASQPTTTAA